ncbi:hypothetical protein FRC00_002881 [Tulasnella sp. 408]|nr:hypothetical protein FRC00_002881 [Tulasnella sp. 408]
MCPIIDSLPYLQRTSSRKVTAIGDGDDGDDEMDDEVILRGPVEENPVFASVHDGEPELESKGPTPTNKTPNTIATKAPEYLSDSPMGDDIDNGYDTWNGIGSSDREHDSPSSPVSALFSTSSQLHQTPSLGSANAPALPPQISTRPAEPTHVVQTKGGPSDQHELKRPGSTHQATETQHRSLLPIPSIPRTKTTTSRPSPMTNRDQDTGGDEPARTLPKGSRHEAERGSRSLEHDNPVVAATRKNPQVNEVEAQPSIIRDIFEARGETPLREYDGAFGLASPAQEGYEGFATRFYPERDQPLQIPAGEIEEDALTLRWRWISEEDMMVVKNYEDNMHRNLPARCRDLIKGTTRAVFDPEVHRWMACRIKVFSEFPERSTEKADYIDTVIEEFFYRFADLHPSNMFLKDEAMEIEYVGKIKASLRSRASELKAKLQGSSQSVRKAIATYVPFLDKILHRDGPPRPSDLFFEEDGMQEMTKPLWVEHWAEVKEQLIETKGSEAVANRYRISSYMAWRNWFFYDSKFVPDDVKNEFIQEAATHDKTAGLTRSQLILEGLPVINNLLYEFSTRTGIPFMLAMTWQDPEHDGRLQTMLQTGRGQAPTDISDFRHSSSFVDADFLPRWRAWTSRVYDLQDDAPHAMYEHITPDEAAGSPEGSVPTIPAYDGGLDTSSDGKTAKARVDALKYIGDRWCKANYRLRANHDQIQLDINDKVPKERLPKAMRSIEIERVMANGDTVVESVQREVVVSYTKLTVMPLADFLVWLHHISDPDIPPENQFFFSAELRKAVDAGAEMPITVQVALDPNLNLNPREDTTAPTNSLRSRNVNSLAAPREKDPKKPRRSKGQSSNSKDGQVTRKSGSTKTGANTKRRAKEPTSDEGESEEEILFPSSDEQDDLSDRDLVEQPQRGSRQSERIKGKEKEQEQASRRSEAVPEQPASVASDARGDGQGSTTMEESQRRFLSSVSIMTPARRIPAAFSLSPEVDRLDSSTTSQVIASLVNAKSQFQNLPSPAFPCSEMTTGLSAPKAVIDVLTLLSLLDHLFPNRPKLYHPAFRTATYALEPVEAALQSAVSAQVWDSLNNPDVPIPLASTLQRLCAHNPQYMEDTFETASIFLRQALEALRRQSLLSGEKEVYTATDLFFILCRYIVFLGRNPNFTRKVQAFVNIIAEWGSVLITVTYAVHTAQGALLRYPHHSLSDPITPANAIPTLLSSFITFLYGYLSRRQYTLSDAVCGDFLFLDLEKAPCFALSNSNNRWFRAVPDAVMEVRLSTFFSRRLEIDPETFHDMPIVGHMELLTVVCALHRWPGRAMANEEWIAWLESLRASILRRTVNGTAYNNIPDRALLVRNAVDEGGPFGDDATNCPPRQTDPEGATAKAVARLPPAANSKPISNANHLGDQILEGQDSQLAWAKEAQIDVTAPSAPSGEGDEVILQHPGSPVTAEAPRSDPSGSGLVLPPLGSSGWLPGDKAKLVMNKKLRDVEFVEQDGALQMRDAVTKKPLADRHRKPKPLPDFEEDRLYHRIPTDGAAMENGVSVASP